MNPNYQRALTYQQPRQSSSLQTLKIIPKKSAFFTDDFIEGNVELTTSVQVILNDINLVLNSNQNWVTFSKEINANITEKNNDAIATVNLDVKRKLNINTNLVALKPGKFNFGFKFKIPKIVEPSFEYPTAESKAYLRYYLAANIISPYIKGNATIYIILKRRQRIEMNKQLTLKAENNVRKWGLFSGGKTIMEIITLNGTDNFRFGEDLNFNINIDNTNGKLNTLETKIDLNRFIIFKNSYGQTKKEIKDELFKKTIKTESIPGEKKTFPFTLSLKKIENKNFVIKDSGIPYTNISDLNYFLPSIKTIILECYYSIKFTLYFTNFVKFDDRPRIIMNITICHQSLGEYNAEMNQKLGMNNNIPPQMMPPPNMMGPGPHMMPPNMVPPHMMPPPPNMMPMGNNNMNNTPLCHRNMSMPNNNGPNPQFDQMNNNNQDGELPSMEEVEVDNNNQENNFNDYNNNNNMKTNFGDNMNNNDDNNFDYNMKPNLGNNNNNNYNQNINENNNEPPSPAYPGENELPEYPEEPINNQ